MNYLKDFIYVQLEALKSTFRNFRYIFIVGLTIIAGSFAVNIISNLLSGVLIAGGMSIIVGTLIYILEIFVISIIMSALFVAIKENSSFSGFISVNNSQFFYKVIQIGFIFYIFRLVFRITGMHNAFDMIFPILLIIFNALPEAIYLEEYDGMGTLTKSLDFLKNNIINWAIPNIIIFVILYFVKIDYILPFSIHFNANIQSIIVALIKVLVYSIFLIYRGNLFETLNGSSMRKRDYMRKMQ